MSTAAPLQSQAAKSQPSSNSTHAGLLLQRKCACGSATSSLTGECPECRSGKRVQAKITVGASNDPLEQEADRVADQVLGGATHSAASGAPPHIQRFTGQATGQTDTTAPASVDRVLAGSGRPLGPALRQEMEQRFGHDFSRVRVHSGAASDKSARDVNAHAYTAGHNIVFGAGRYEPGTYAGRRLIAHELAHVVPQTGEEAIHAGQSNEKRGLSPISRATLQGQEAERGDLLQGHVGATENRTGMPDKLIVGLEQLSGVDLSAVRVHYNSTEPAKLNALAYTHGKDIQIGPGQEKHLPHEGWHVVQQMQARVKPTMQMRGILLNDDGGLEREADVMGAKAPVLGELAGAAGFHARLATASGEGLDDEPFVVAMAPAAQRVASQLVKPTMSTSNVPVIQRVANFVAGTVSATTNLAAHVIAGNRDMGFTPPTLNGTATMSAADAHGAILSPVLGGRSKPDGTQDTWVNTVPTNEASFTMQVPSGGPWSTVTPKANVATLFTSLGLAAQAGCSTAGDSTFSFNGKRTDADFAANVRTHEDIHAADHKIGFNNVIVPWDTKLEAAKTATTVFNAATAAAAEAALFTAMGGTPNQIATAQFNEWVRINNITHRGATLATGGTATPSNSAANATCTTSSLDAT
jgi:hypothetical protein